MFKLSSSHLPAKPFGRQAARLALIGGAMTVLIVVAVGYLLLDSRRAAYDTAMRRSHDVVLGLGSNVRRTVESLDRSLRAAIRDMELRDLLSLGAQARHALQFEGALDAEEFGGVGVFDSTGKAIPRSESRGQLINVADRDYFQAHRRDPNLGLLMDGPYLGRNSGGTRLILSRRIDNLDGSFAGVASGTIRLDAFSRLFEAMIDGQGGSIALFTASGDLLLQEPPMAPDVDVERATSAGFHALFADQRALLAGDPGTLTELPKQLTSGVFRPDLPANEGGNRFIVYQRLGAFPLVIALSLSEDEVYAGWTRRITLVTAGGLVLTALAVMLAWGLRRELARRSDAERAAVESSDQVRLLTDYSGDMLVRLDWDGIQHYVSPAGLAVLGRPATELVGRSWLEFAEPDDRATLSASLLDLRYDGEYPTTVVRIRHPDGSLRHVEARGTALPDGTGAILVERDVTSRIHMEERLRQSHRMQALGQLTAGVAHDFNNMLQAQLGCLELLIDELPGIPGPRRLAQQALQLGERGARLTSQLLSFSRQQILFPESVVLDDFLAGLTETLRRTMGPDIRVISTVRPGTPALFADRAHLESALLNLSLNARDAMASGGTIRIEAFSQPAADGLVESERIVLAVQDEGVGMDAATIERACEPFFTTKGLNGTGLGLASVLGFANQSGGELTISSVPGQGTTMCLVLPRAQGSTESPVVAPTHVTGGARLLVVDDTPEVLLAVTATLEYGGFEVVYCASPALALDAFATDGPFDCLVTDYAMPGMNGGDLVQEVRSRLPAMPALIITGWADIEALDRLGDTVEVLRKPFRRDALLQHVHHLIAAAVTRREHMQLAEEI